MLRVRLGFSILCFVLIAFALPARAQVLYSISEPEIDSFPIVRIEVNVTENGGPAYLVGPQNFQVNEDGASINAFDLWGCGGTLDAAIAFVVDTSNSMVRSAGFSVSGGSSGFNVSLDNAVAQFLASIPGPSQLTIVPFADSSLDSYPGPARSYFYNSTNSTDTTLFTQRLNSLALAGKGTDVDAGIINGINVLLHSSLPRRIIILVTDAAVTGALNLEQDLKAAGVTLYVLQVTRDSVGMNYANHDLAVVTGGDYYAAYDTTRYLPGLLSFAQRIFSEHCTLRYVSTAPCPYEKQHTVELDLHFKGQSRSGSATYNLGSNMHDANAPLFSVQSASTYSQLVSATDPFPCESGMQTLLDSASSNFRQLRPSVVNSGMASDSIAVIDTLYPADAYYVARDSAGNTSRIHVHYEPTPDIHAPQFAPYIWKGVGVLTLDIEEKLPWDRGLYSIMLRPGVTNLVLDSIIYSNSHAARAYFHLPNAQGPASACLIARDSAGNIDTACIQLSGDTSDIYPPLFVQDQIAEPRVSISGVVTEKRLFDKGIRKITVTPLANTSSPAQNFISAAEANVSVAVNDSFFAARALVEAYDSAGHYMRDTLRYEPLPDTLSPLLNYITPQITTFIFTASDDRAWDRGIATLALLPTSTNVTATAPIFTDVYHASLTATVVDQAKDATVSVQVTDSAGHQATALAQFTGVRLVPLGQTTIDFGTITAPAAPSILRSIIVTNPNDIPVSLDLSALSGDAAVFRIVTPNPVLFAARGSQTLTFEFDPALLGAWRATTSFQHDTATLGAVTLMAKTLGTFRLALDTVRVAHEELPSILHLSIDADPKPINLDTIAFSVTYDPDVITLGDFETCAAGALDTGVCLYNASWTGGAEGSRDATLLRRASTQTATLSFGRTELSIPFVSHLAKDSSTVVHIRALNSSSASALATYDGLVIVGSSCGTKVIRSAMAGNLLVSIEGLSPNPASGSLTLRVRSESVCDATVRLVSVLGVTVKEYPLHLQPGEHIMTIEDLPSVSGPYEVVLRVNGMDIDRKRIEVLR